MATVDLNRLNLNLLPIQDETFKPPPVETNFREISEAARLLKDAVKEIQGVLVISPEGVFIIPVGRYTETFTASSSKVVTHNSGLSHPQVSVYRSDGRLIQTIVTNVDTNTVRLDFTGTLTAAVVAVDFAQT